jgi:hypothetical protein
MREPDTVVGELVPIRRPKPINYYYARFAG